MLKKAAIVCVHVSRLLISYFTQDKKQVSQSNLMTL